MRSVKAVSGRLYEIRLEESTKRTGERVTTRLINTLGHWTMRMVYMCRNAVGCGMVWLF